MINMRKVLILLFFSLSLPAYCILPSTSPFDLIELYIDTSRYTSNENIIIYQNKRHIFFNYSRNNQVMEVYLYPKKNQNIKKLALQPSLDYYIIDTLKKIDDFYRFKVQFQNITKSSFLKFTFDIVIDTNNFVYDVNILPVANFDFTIRIPNDELFVGEEKEIEILTSNPENIKSNPIWTSGNVIDYRIIEKDGRAFLYVLPNQVGKQRLNVKITTFKPRLNNKKELEYEYNIIHDVIVKSSRLQYISFDQKEYQLDEDSRSTGIDVQIDYTRLIEFNKTYRIENKEQPGGVLIGELFTKYPMGSNKIMATLRLYNYHRQQNGYLYIKDCDNTKFITNFSVIPKTQITQISILREGKDWVQNLNVYPGEVIDVRINGEALHRAKITFEDVIILNPNDTFLISENELRYKLKIPLDINKRTINIYNYGKPTGYRFNIREFQDARIFDFVKINYGDKTIPLTQIHGPILYDKTVNDVVFTFDFDKIDGENQLYGKQFLKFDIQITNLRNDLIEMRTITNVNVCPSKTSPRYEYYEKRDCWNGDLRLNKYIRKKTYDLDEWSRIQINVSHDPSKHTQEAYSKEIEIILKRKYKFDIDVSFPAGLITVYRKTKTNNETGVSERVTEFGNLGGVSMAMIAQFSFYHPQKIAVLRPYKIGAGFIALNAFNLSSNNTNQDLAFVILGSLYPTSRDNRLSFPLFLGGGYKMLDKSWMFLIGPGIRIRI